MQMNENILKFCLYSMGLNLLFTPIKSSIAGIFGYSTIILFVLSWIMPIFHSGKLMIDKSVIWIISSVFLAFGTSVGSLFYHPLGNTVDGLVAMVSFFVFYWILAMPPQKNCVLKLQDLFIPNYFISLIYIVYAFGPFEFKYNITDRYGNKVLGLGLGNPNGVSLLVLFSIVFLIFDFISSKKRMKKSILAVLICILSYILYLLSSRTVLFCLILVLLFYILKLKKIEKFFLYFVLILPVLMIAFQFWVSNSSSKFELLGKNINTGRSELYLEFFSMFRENPQNFVFGNLCETWFYNYHNGIITILSSLGVFGLFSYFQFWLKQLKQLSMSSFDFCQRIAFLTISLMLVHSSSESMAVVGTIPYCVFIILIMKIAKGDIRSKYD